MLIVRATLPRLCLALSLLNCGGLLEPPLVVRGEQLQQPIVALAELAALGLVGVAERHEAFAVAAELHQQEVGLDELLADRAAALHAAARIGARQI